MRIFEKEEKPTVEVCRVSYNGDDIEAQFKEGYQTKVVKGSRSPHEDLLAAFGELTRLVQHKLMLTNATYCPCRIKATSVKFVSTDKYTGYSIKSTLTFPSIGTEFNGSSILFIPYSGYWEQEDEDGNPRHDPDDEPQNLTDDEIEILEQASPKPTPTSMKARGSLMTRWTSSTVSRMNSRLKLKVKVKRMQTSLSTTSLQTQSRHSMNWMMKVIWRMRNERIHLS